MLLLLILVPVVAAGLALVVRSDAIRRCLLIGTGTAHFCLATAVWQVRPGPIFRGWLMVDAPGLVFLMITSVLFLIASIYAVGYLQAESVKSKKDFEEGVFFTNAPEAIFSACLLMFLATMTLVTMSQHLGILWVAMEATTLTSAPLIYFHRHHRSLEATWKYLLICSVGIALALLGTFFMVAAASRPGTDETSLVLGDLVRQAGKLNVPWLKAAFLFFLVGYGTKMGLAPLHTWLPDAHSESPSVVSALLSGALLNCAFLGILRSQQVCAAAGLETFGRELLVLFGLISIAWAAVFILGQADYKRMLAYSSVEHMGILALGVGLGGAGAFGAMLHAVNHSLTKALLFFVAGNILAAYKTKTATDVRGVLRVIPWSGVLWVAGFLAITGLPPFGIFVSEFTIIKAILDQGRVGVAVAFLALLSLIFLGMSSTVLKMAQGRSAVPAAGPAKREAMLAVVPPAILSMLILLLGLYLPPGIGRLLHEATRGLGGN